MAVASRQRQVTRDQEERQAADAITLPDWILERHHTQLGIDPDGFMEIVYMAGTPFEDLNRVWAGGFGNTLQNIVSDATPWLRVPFELAADHSVYTDQPISDPSYRNLYTRAWTWSDKLPGLRDWLGIKREESPSGRISYRSNNPVPMYVLASLIGRPLRSVSNVGAVIEDLQVGSRQNLGQAGLGLATGVKVFRVAPKLPSSLSVREGLQQSPAATALYNQYRDLALYPQFNDPRASQTATKAKANIDSSARYLVRTAEMDRATAVQAAASRYKDIDPNGHELWSQIQENGWKQEGKAARREFLDQNPELARVFSGLSPQDARVLLNQVAEELPEAT